MADWEELRREILATNSSNVLPPSIELPILPKALNDFRSKSEDVNVEIRELAEIVSSDVGLSTEILRFVNSSASGFTSEITSVNHAISALGIKKCTLHLTVCAMKNSMRTRASKLVNIQNFWNSNLERALFAKEIATLFGVDADLAFTGAMLQDVLLPVVTSQLTNGYLEFLENRDDYISITDFENKHFGWDHALAAASMLHAWSFPDELVCCVACHHNLKNVFSNGLLSETTVAAIALASLIPDALRQEKNGVKRLIEFESECSGFELLETAKVVADHFKSMNDRASSHISLLKHCEKAMRE